MVDKHECKHNTATRKEEGKVLVKSPLTHIHTNTQCQAAATRRAVRAVNRADVTVEALAKITTWFVNTRKLLLFDQFGRYSVCVQ